jgi:hypothetical protein
LEIVAMRRWYAAIAVLLLLAISSPTGLDSCGIGAPTAIFATVKGPADDGEFLTGRLGVLKSTYDRRYLIAAFRIMSEVPLTQEERDSVLIDPPPSGEVLTSGTAAWESARRTVPGAQPIIGFFDVYKKVQRNGYLNYFQNCYGDAFATAAGTLLTLAAKWRSDDPRVREWLTAQDQVFADCAAEQPTIPTPLGDDADPLLAAHRRYQIAAAYSTPANRAKRRKRSMRSPENQIRHGMRLLRISQAARFCAQGS